MGDKKEKDMTKVTEIADGSYIRMLDASGNSVQIDKDSFIEAIRETLPEANALKNGLMGRFAFMEREIISSDQQLDDLKTNGYHSLSSATNFSCIDSGYGFVLSYRSLYGIQIAFSFFSNIIAYRMQTETGVWHQWRRISF